MNSSSPFRSFAAKLQLQNRVVKLFIVASVDLFFLIPAVLLAYMLRYSSFEFPTLSILPLYLVGPILSVVIARFGGVYDTVSRTYTTDIESKILRSQIIVTPIWALIVIAYGAFGFARSVILIYFLLAVLVMILLRKLTSRLIGNPTSYVVKHEQTPVIIYGAGREGVALAEGLRRQGRYRPLAFIDTDYTLTGRTVGGLKVYATEDVEKVMAQFNPREVLVAKLGQNRASRRAIVDMFISHGLSVKTIPDVQELAGGDIDVMALRPVKLEDLLGRDPVPPDRAMMEKALKGQVVLVTGAGGSIGSELVRQAAAFSPKRIVMLDNSEFSLFEINREMEQRFSSAVNTHPSLIAILADIGDEAMIQSIMAEQKVSVVLHAAAYKHVRMVQENALMGIRNNVWGTKLVAEAAIRQKVKLFVLVSTDKAVRPTSIMGASKRVAEMVVQSLALDKKHSTVMTMVRFGNVLGSTGSVVPLFREQITKGGPVQVTHPEVTRFFMLIPEAAQLVIQAGAMAEGGEVFVLDMGESVKIIDLATAMIELAGLTLKTPTNPSGDIEIIFSGLKDGEKLYEELQIGKDVNDTSNPRIMRSNEPHLAAIELAKRLKNLSGLIDRNNEKSAVAYLFDLAKLGSF